MKKLLYIACGLLTPLCALSQETSENAKTEIAASFSCFGHPNIRGESRSEIGQFAFATTEGEFRAGAGYGRRYGKTSVGILAGFKNDPENVLNAGAYVVSDPWEHARVSAIAMLGKGGMWSKGSAWFVLERKNGEIEAPILPGFVWEGNYYGAGCLGRLGGFLFGPEFFPAARRINFAFEYEFE